MPLSSLFSNLFSSRSTKLQRRTSTLSRKKQIKDKPENEQVAVASDTRPSAPPHYQNHSDQQLQVAQIHLNDDSSTRGNSLKLLRMDSAFPESFWDIGNYKYVLKRCDNGNKLSGELSDMISERAKLEEAYAKSIKQWSKKWSDHLNNESTEYESTKDAWYAFLEAGNQTADIHSETCKVRTCLLFFSRVLLEK